MNQYKIGNSPPCNYAIRQKTTYVKLIAIINSNIIIIDRMQPITKRSKPQQMRLQIRNKQIESYKSKIRQQFNHPNPSENVNNVNNDKNGNNNDGYSNSGYVSYGGLEDNENTIDLGMWRLDEYNEQERELKWDIDFIAAQLASIQDQIINNFLLTHYQDEHQYIFQYNRQLKQRYCAQLDNILNILMRIQEFNPKFASKNHRNNVLHLLQIVTKHSKHGIHIWGMEQRCLVSYFYCRYYGALLKDMKNHKNNHNSHNVNASFNISSNSNGGSSRVVEELEVGLGYLNNIINDRESPVDKLGRSRKKAMSKHKNHCKSQSKAKSANKSNRNFLNLSKSKSKKALKNPNNFQQPRTINTPKKEPLSINQLQQQLLEQIALLCHAHLLHPNHFHTHHDTRLILRLQLLYSWYCRMYLHELQTYQILHTITDKEGNQAVEVNMDTLPGNISLGAIRGVLQAGYYNITALLDNSPTQHSFSVFCSFVNLVQNCINHTATLFVQYCRILQQFPLQQVQESQPKSPEDPTDTALGILLMLGSTIMDYCRWFAKEMHHFENLREGEDWMREFFEEWFTGIQNKDIITCMLSLVRRNIYTPQYVRQLYSYSSLTTYIVACVFTDLPTPLPQTQPSEESPPPSQSNTQTHGQTYEQYREQRRREVEREDLQMYCLHVVHEFYVKYGIIVDYVQNLRFRYMQRIGDGTLNNYYIHMIFRIIYKIKQN